MERSDLNKKVAKMQKLEENLGSTQSAIMVLQERYSELEKSYQNVVRES